MKQLAVFTLIALLLVMPLTACCPQEKLQEAYQTGYNAGFTEGYNAGLAQCEQIGDEDEVIPPPEGEGEEDKELPSGSIQWNEAKDHIGDRLTVCGPVVDSYWSSGSSGKPTFLNIGKPYPDPQRFTVVIWDDYRANFPQPPEEYYLGKTICVTGLIEEYNGSPQIEAQQLSQIQDP